MNTSITVQSNDNPLRQIASAAAETRRGKDIAARIGAYLAYTDQWGVAWHKPDLRSWRDHLLLDGLSQATVKAYLSTVRGSYNAVLRDNSTRDLLYSMTDPAAPPADRAAFVAEVLIRLQNAIHPSAAPVDSTTIQDRADSEHLRLTAQQAAQLLSRPDHTTLAGLRDLAILAVLLCTGIREDELCSLQVSDLRQSLGGEAALLVRHGKGNKQRLIPYGDLDWCLPLTEAWLHRAGISSGAVFRKVYKGGGTISDSALSTVAIQRIVKAYPITVAGRLVSARPHDLRRTYARLQYDAGAELVAIQQNLGHTSGATTLAYIGTLDAERRRGRAVLSFDLGQVLREGH